MMSCNSGEGAAARALQIPEILWLVLEEFVPLCGPYVQYSEAVAPYRLVNRGSAAEGFELTWRHPKATCLLQIPHELRQQVVNQTTHLRFEDLKVDHKDIFKACESLHWPKLTSLSSILPIVQGKHTLSYPPS